MSGSKSKTTSNQTTNQTATTTPNAPSWIQQPTENYYAQVNNLANSGQPLVAGPSELQQQAFQGAANLGQPRIGGNMTGGGASVFDLAGMLGLNAGTAGANTTDGTALSRFSGYRPAAEAQAQGYQGQGYTAGGPAEAGGYTASGPAGGRGYTASGPFTPQGYDPSQATSQGYQAQGYQAGMVDPNAFQVGQTTVGPMTQATARNFTDANFSAYENPYTTAVTDTTMADIDANDGRIRAQQAAQQAANGGVRNSNNAVLSALTEGELSRARASSLANIRSQGFNTSAGLITGDNDRQANVSQFNAGQANQGVLAQAQADASRNQLLAQLQSAGIMSNQSAGNDAARFGAGAANDAGQFNSGLNAQTSQFNTGQTNDARSLLSQQLQQAGLDFAGRQDQAGQFGADAFNRSAQDYAGRSDQAGQFGADARNRSALDAAGRQDQAGAFGANARNQASQFGADAANRAGLDFAGRSDQAGQFGANAFNQNSQNNAAALNQSSQFNAGQQDNALMRQLQAAGLLGNLGTTMSADNRANIGMQAELGGQQREIRQRQMAEEYQRLAMLQGLLGVNPNNFIGQAVVSNGTQSGNQTTTQNPSLLTSIGQGASTAASLAALFSDRRLKADIKPVGTDAKGRKWYDYRYLWDAVGTVHRGVMAQEILASDPQAVGTRAGFFTVDYSKLEMA